MKTQLRVTVADYIKSP